MSATMETQPRDEGLDLIEAALDQLMTIDDWQLTDEHLVQQMDRLGTIGDRVHGLRLARIRAVDERGSCGEVGAYATSDRIALTDRTAPPTAKHQVKTAKDLSRYPVLQEACERGLVTREQLREVLLGLQWVPDTAEDEDLTIIEKQIVEYAASHPPAAMRKLTNRLVAVRFPDAEDDLLNTQLERDERRAHERRSLTWKRDGEGSLFVRLQLPELDGAKLKHLVNTFLTRPTGLDQQLDPDAEQPTIDQRRADAFVEMVDQFYRDQPDTGTGSESGMDTGSGSGPSAPSGSAGGSPANVSVILDFNDLIAGTGTGTLVDTDHPISATAARQLACQANLVPVVLGRDGEVLDVGRTSRLVTPAIRKALIVRDRGCVFPGCDAAPHRCDAHHVIPWQAGGPTDLGNLVLVCRHHHRIVEPDPRAGPGAQWTITFDSHGIPWIRPPIRLDPNRTPHRNARFT